MDEKHEKVPERRDEVVNGAPRRRKSDRRPESQHHDAADDASGQDERLIGATRLPRKGNEEF